jgi:hypothetical protein
MAMWVVLISPALGFLPTLLCETGIKTNNDVDPCALVRTKDSVRERKGSGRGRTLRRRRVLISHQSIEGTGSADIRSGDSSPFRGSLRAL